jgi:hypothetical protein
VPVRKFRSLEEAERSLWREPGDPAIWEAAKARWAIHRALGAGPPSPPRGVRRYRSIEDKQRDEPA